MNIGQRIRERRKSLGLSAEQVAEMMNVSPSTIYRYESNEIMNMGIDKVKPIAALLKVSASYLMGWTEDPEPKDFPYSSPDLTEDEQKLLSLFSQLNAEGRSKVLEYVEDLAGNRRYTEDDSELLRVDA